MINQELDKLVQSADLPDTANVVTDTEAPFILPPEEQQSVFTGESEQVAINFKGIGENIIEKFSKGKKVKAGVTKVNEAGNPAVTEVPVGDVKIQKEKPITKAKQKQIDKIKEEATQQPIISTEEMKATAKDEAERVAFNDSFNTALKNIGTSSSNISIVTYSP
jgi:hypothetical protein